VLPSSPITAFLSPPIASPLSPPAARASMAGVGKRRRDDAGMTRGWRGDEAPERGQRAREAGRRHRRAMREKDGGTGSWGSSTPSRGAPPPGSSAGEGMEGAASPAQLRYCPSRRLMGGGREGAARHKVSSTCVSSSCSCLRLPPTSRSAVATVSSPSSTPIMSVVGCSSPSWRWRWAFPLLSWCRREGPVGVYGLIL
jgi:hypothetical protein